MHDQQPHRSSIAAALRFPAREGAMTKSFARVAAGAAAIAAIAGLIYTVTFALVVQEGYRWAQWVSSFALLGGAMALFVVMIGARRQFAGVQSDFGLLGLILGVVGATGAATHAVFD